jgi:RNA polymerase sigma-70 factor (ECF subfamily)
VYIVQEAIIVNNLIQRCKSGDKEAFEELFDVYKSHVYKTALLFSKNRILAEDIAQEVFIRVFTKIKLYDEEYSFDVWLYKIVINVTRNMLRKQRWLSFFDPQENDFDQADLNTPDLNYIQKEQEIMIRQFIDHLPYKQKEVIILKYFKGFTQEEIANIIQIPLGTVKSRINGGLEKLRMKFDRKINYMEVLSDEQN